MPVYVYLGLKDKKASADRLKAEVGIPHFDEGDTPGMKTRAETARDKYRQARYDEIDKDIDRFDASREVSGIVFKKGVGTEVPEGHPALGSIGPSPLFEIAKAKPKAPPPAPKKVTKKKVTKKVK